MATVSVAWLPFIWSPFPAGGSPKPSRKQSPRLLHDTPSSYALADSRNTLDHTARALIVEGKGWGVGSVAEQLVQRQSRECPGHGSAAQSGCSWEVRAAGLGLGSDVLPQCAGWAKGPTLHSEPNSFNKICFIPVNEVGFCCLQSRALTGKCQISPWKNIPAHISVL